MRKLLTVMAFALIAISSANAEIEFREMSSGPCPPDATVTGWGYYSVWEVVGVIEQCIGYYFYRCDGVGEFYPNTGRTKQENGDDGGQRGPGIRRDEAFRGLLSPHQIATLDAMLVRSQEMARRFGTKARLVLRSGLPAPDVMPSHGAPGRSRIE